jgi:hypothetical protein
MDEHSKEVKNALLMPFSNFEKELLRFCAQCYCEKPDEVAYKDLPGYKDPGYDKIQPVLSRLIQLKLLRGFSDKAIKVLPGCVELVHTWENPPLPDRWGEATKWFRSKRWSLPVLVIAVGLPALKGWVDVIKMLLDWMGITHVGSK